MVPLMNFTIERIVQVVGSIYTLQLMVRTIVCLRIPDSCMLMVENWW